MFAASVLLAALLFSGFVRAEPALQVKYPNLDGLESNAYGYRVLNLALRKSGVDFELVAAVGMSMSIPGQSCVFAPARAVRARFASRYT